MNPITNRYSLKESNKLGTFYHNLPYYDFPENFDFDSPNLKNELNREKMYKEFKIDRLKNDELIDNWIKVLPKFLIRNKEINEFVWDKNKLVDKKITRGRRQYVLSVIKLNLTELPNHLWNKIKPKYKEGKLSHYYVRENIYKYFIIPTYVDDDIKELRRLLNSKLLLKKTFRLQTLINNIKKEELNGWLLKKAEKILYTLKT